MRAAANPEYQALDIRQLSPGEAKKGAARDLTDKWFALFADGRFDDLGALIAGNAEIVMPGGMRFRGFGELRPMLEAYRNGFPDLRHETVAAVETGDSIGVELKIVMTHTGPFVTPVGELPPTGRTVTFDGCDVVRLGLNGTITSWHSYFDQASFMAQLGVGS